MYRQTIVMKVRILIDLVLKFKIKTNKSGKGQILKTGEQSNFVSMERITTIIFI